MLCPSDKCRPEALIPLEYLNTVMLFPDKRAALLICLKLFNLTKCRNKMAKTAKRFSWEHICPYAVCIHKYSDDKDDTQRKKVGVKRRYWQTQL